ncbi:MAG: 1-deoxy-D-xylulose-5-phosphate synthase, partial [Ignavibacteriaceae bacterium]|nr:1-deoxy-D-xylulose-5-phosphate synthase [Ignavibacteriaceae bacterium]
VSDQKKIFVLEDHSAIGGLGDRLLNQFVSISANLPDGSQVGGLEFKNFGLTEYPECGTPLEVLEFHKLDGKSLAQRISGVTNIGTAEAVEQNYTTDAPQ